MTATLPQFRIVWRDVTEVAADVVTGMTEEEAAQAARLDKPLLVYVYDDSDEPDARLAVEKDKAFLAEEVFVGARFFDCVRMDLETAKSDGVLRKAGVDRAGLVFVRPNLEVTATLNTRFKARTIFAAMCKTLDKDYENCARKALRKQRDLNKQRVKLDREREKITRLDAKLDEIRSAKGRQKLQRERDRLGEELAAETAKIDAAEAKLYALEPKST